MGGATGRIAVRDPVNSVSAKAVSGETHGSLRNHFALHRPTGISAAARLSIEASRRRQC
jgi:hypothetical protein